MFHPTRLWPLALTLTLAACDKGGGNGDTTEDLYGCQEDDTVAITDLSLLPDGFSATPQATLDLMTGAFTGDLVRTTETLPGTLTITSTGRASRVHRSVHDDGSGMELAIGDTSLECGDILKLPAVFAISTPDALNATFDADIVVTTTGATAFYGSVDFADVGGNATPTGFNPADMDKTTLMVQADSDAANAWVGTLNFQGEDSQPGTGGGDGTASATQEEWATFTLSKD